jgi:ankyrin repeat protein
MAAAEEGNRKVIDMLLAAGANPKLRDEDGETAYSLAEESDNEKAAETLRNAVSRSN